jgi:hypothetical protein
MKCKEKQSHRYEAPLMSNLSWVIQEKGQLIGKGTASTKA